MSVANKLKESVYTFINGIWLDINDNVWFERDKAIVIVSQTPLHRFFLFLILDP